MDAGWKPIGRWGHVCCIDCTELSSERDPIQSNNSFTANHKENDDYNETCVKAVIKAGGILVSVAFDGLSTERTFIANKLLQIRALSA